MTPTTLAVIGLAFWLPQGPESRPANGAGKDPAQAESRPVDVLAVFRAFANDKKDTVLRGLLRRVQLDSNYQIQRIVSMQRGAGKLPVRKPLAPHDPRTWAPGVAPPRTLVRAGSAAHTAMRRKLPAVEFLPRLHRHVSYDWGSCQIVRRATELSPDEVVENLWNGYPPGSDWAVAQILDRLNQDARQRKVGSYLDHQYADLNARSYEGITLYEAWYSGEAMAVPDVDAIPFARQVLRDSSFRSPIPANRRRDRLYQEIREHALSFRIYRTLIEAAAASYVSADPGMEEEYKKLLPRFYYLWVVHDDDLDEIAKQLARIKDREGRDRFLLKITARLEKEPKEYRKYEQRTEELQVMAARLRAITEHMILKAREW